MALLSKIKSSKTFKKNSYKIGGVYYYATSAFDSSDLLEIAGYLRSIIKKDTQNFKVSYQELMAIFDNDTIKTNKLIYAFTQVNQTTNIPVFNITEESGNIFVEIVEDLDAIIYDVYGVSTYYGFSAIGIDWL